MYRNFSITEQEKKQILEMHQSKGYKTSLNENDQNIEESSEIDPARVTFFNNLAKQISSKIVGKKYFFGNIGVLKNNSISVQKYVDRNHAINLVNQPINEFNLYFEVRRTEEDLNKGEKYGARPWYGTLSISARYTNGQLSSTPIVELFLKENNKTYFENSMTPSKPWTWDMVGGVDLWSKVPSMGKK